MAGGFEVGAFVVVALVPDCFPVAGTLVVTPPVVNSVAVFGGECNLWRMEGAMWRSAICGGESQLEFSTVVT